MMLWLLKFCLFGHVHKWETIAKGELTGNFGGLGYRYHLRCEKCGEVTKRDLV